MPTPLNRRRIATARLVVQMTPAEKQSLDARASRAGLTTSEFVRRRIAHESLEEVLADRREEIEALLTILEASASRHHDSLP